VDLGYVRRGSVGQFRECRIAGGIEEGCLLEIGPEAMTMKLPKMGRPRIE
jgi:hypothetical protein